MYILLINQKLDGCTLLKEVLTQLLALVENIFQNMFIMIICILKPMKSQELHVKLKELTMVNSFLVVNGQENNE